MWLPLSLFSDHVARAYVSLVRNWFLFLPGATSLLLCPEVFAQNQHIALDYTAEPACPTRAEFIAQVSARTRLADFTDDAVAERRFFLSVRTKGGQVVGRLSGPNSDPSTTAREVASDNCADVVSALALITALAIDPHADLTEAPARGADDGTPLSVSSSSKDAVPDQGGGGTGVGSQPVASQTGGQIAARRLVARTPGIIDGTLRTVPVPSATDSRRPWRDAERRHPCLLGAGVEGALWPSSPAVFWGGVSLLLEWQFPWRTNVLSAVRLDIAHVRSVAVHRSGGGAARFVQNVAAFDACPFGARWAAAAVQGCVGVETGWIVATGLADVTIVSTERHNRPWWALHEQVELIMDLGQDWATVLDLGITEPLWRDHFVFNFPSTTSASATQTEFLRTPAWSARAALRLARRF